MPERPQLRITVFSDYICPFCHVADQRLLRLRDSFDLRINWCWLEIHPETPAEGAPIESLGYAPERWQALMQSLAEMSAGDGLQMAEHDWTTNSHRALLLAEAAKLEGAEVFYPLHRALFRAFFEENRNIGDPAVLRELALEAGVPEARIEAAWNEPVYEQRLARYRAAAAELGVQATPTCFIGERRINGVVPEDLLRSAAEAALRAGGAHG